MTRFASPRTHAMPPHQPVRVIRHGNVPVLVDEEPIRIAIAPGQQPGLLHSIILHPRYALADVPQQEVVGHLRGRTIEIPNPEIGNDGVAPSYTVLNFKGVGASIPELKLPDGTRHSAEKMVIIPGGWYCDGRFFDEPDQHNRSWGLLTAVRLEGEFGNTALQLHGIPEVDYIQVNVPTPGVVEQIRQINGGRGASTLEPVQIVRGMTTNIRLGDIDPPVGELRDTGIAKTLATAGVMPNIPKCISFFASITKMQMTLAKQDQVLETGGSISGNMTIDGQFIDRGNPKIVEYNESEVHLFALRMGNAISVLMKWMRPGIPHTIMRELLDELDAQFATIGITMPKRASTFDIQEAIEHGICAIERASRDTSFLRRFMAGNVDG